MGKLSNMRPAIATLGTRLRPPPKIVEQFYSSPDWRALVARLKRERGSRCARCGSSDRIIADHVVERRDGGADLDPSNIELMCAKHHGVKTAQARARRAKGQA